MISCYEPSHKNVSKIRNLIIQHFKARNIPEKKHDELYYRWLRTKGLRAPIATT